MNLTLSARALPLAAAVLLTSCSAGAGLSAPPARQPIPPSALQGAITRVDAAMAADAAGDARSRVNVDLAQVMYEGFNSEISDVAGALLVRDGDIYVGAAPDFWRLRDTSGDGLIDETELLSSGYGTSPGFFGHGVSGAVNGPDGRIYWSVGDMGFSVVDREGRRWEYPTQGAIFRSDPDGTGFEVFALGLRNTHEFAFDAYGNLITVDNDGDFPGETERLVYLVDGSDSG